MSLDPKVIARDIEIAESLRRGFCEEGEVEPAFDLMRDHLPDLLQHLRDLLAERERNRPRRIDGLLTLVAILLFAAALAVMPGCARPEPRPPLPDVRPTLATLDRAERLVWEHPLTVAVHRSAR